MRTTFCRQSFSKFGASRQLSAIANGCFTLLLKTIVRFFYSLMKRRQTRIISIDNFNVRLFPGESFKAEDMSRIRQIDVQFH